MQFALHSARKLCSRTNSVFWKKLRAFKKLLPSTPEIIHWKSFWMKCWRLVFLNNLSSHDYVGIKKHIWYHDVSCWYMLVDVGRCWYLLPLHWVHFSDTKKKKKKKNEDPRRENPTTIDAAGRQNHPAEAPVSKGQSKHVLNVGSWHHKEMQRCRVLNMVLTCLDLFGWVSTMPFSACDFFYMFVHFQSFQKALCVGWPGFPQSKKDLAQTVPR